MTRRFWDSQNATELFPSMAYFFYLIIHAVIYSNMNALTSVMLITYNRLPLTQRMLQNFFQTTDSPYRLIVVDNGSTDGTVEWLQQLNPENTFCQGYHTHFYDKNKGIAIGRNK